MKLRELIYKYRTEKKLSQRQFATLCDLSNGYISMLEKGQNPKTKQPLVPTLPVLKKIADGMNLSLADMFAMIDDMPIFLSSDVSEDRWTLRFRENLSKHLEFLEQSDCGISKEQLHHLSSIASAECTFSFSDACNVAELLNVSLDEMVNRKRKLPMYSDQQKADIYLDGCEKSSSTDESALEDKLNQQIIDLVKTLTSEQKNLLFALLNTTVAKNLGMPAFAQASNTEATPKAGTRGP